MKLRNVWEGASAVPPPQLTPPPYSHPASNVNVNAALVTRASGLSVVLHLDTVVGVNRFATRVAERVGAPVIVRENRDGSVRSPEDLSADAWRVVELAVRLPAVDEPWLDLQLSLGKICTRMPLKNHGVFEET
jgi:hypothetical protein